VLGGAPGTARVLGGAPDTAHPAVVALVSRPAAGAGAFCSGVLVAPRLVLTAGHCVLGATPAEVTVHVGASWETPDQILGVEEIVVLPRFHGAPEEQRAGLDLAAVVLSDDAGVAPVAYAHSGGDALVGTDATVVGFGLADPLDDTSGGQRRAAVVSVTSACDRMLAFGDDTSGACDGDSGGALFVRDTGGRETLVALVSFGTRPGCAFPAWAVRTDTFGLWIDAMVAGLPDEVCATCPPDPTSCFLADAGIGGDTDPADGAQGCGCSTGGGSRPVSSWIFAWLLAVLGARFTSLRRRSRGRRREQGSKPHT